MNDSIITKIDTIPKKKTEVAISLRDTIKNPNDSLNEIMQRKHTLIIPMINRIYFRKGSFKLKSFYKNNKSLKLNQSDDILPLLLDIHYSILDTLSKRLKEKNASIELAGIYDSGNDSNLALKRAMTLKNYLIKYEHISSSKIKIVVKEVKNINSKPYDELNYVEINCSESEILSPFIINEKLDNFSLSQADYSIFYFFDYDEYEPDFSPMIDFIKQICENFQCSISIHGYSDNSGDINYNSELSQKRANNISKYFTNAIEIKGEGILNIKNSINFLPESKIFSRVAIVNIYHLKK